MFPSAESTHFMHSSAFVARKQHFSLNIRLPLSLFDLSGWPCPYDHKWSPERCAKLNNPIEKSAEFEFRADHTEKTGREKDAAFVSKMAVLAHALTTQKTSIPNDCYKHLSLPHSLSNLIWSRRASCKSLPLFPDMSAAAYPVQLESFFTVRYSNWARRCDRRSDKVYETWVLKEKFVKGKYCAWSKRYKV